MKREKQFKKLVTACLACLHLGKFIYPHEKRDVHLRRQTHFFFESGGNYAHAFSRTEFTAFFHSSDATVEARKRLILFFSCWRLWEFYSSLPFHLCRNAFVLRTCRNYEFVYSHLHLTGGLLLIFAKDFLLPTHRHLRGIRGNHSTDYDRG